MENSIINKITSILISKENITEERVSLLSYVEAMNKINAEIKKIIKNSIKKMNNKLSNNIAFFDHEIKNISLADEIKVNVNHDFKTKTISFSSKDLKVKNDFKNKDIFENLIKGDLKELVDELKKYSYLDKISIKTKENDINVIINPDKVEIFMHKSPNWITMGKAFSLVYDFIKEKYVYEVDSIGLEDNIKSQEKLLFSKISFDNKLLPVELKAKFEELNKPKEEKTKENIITIILNKIRNLMKK